MKFRSALLLVLTLVCAGGSVASVAPPPAQPTSPTCCWFYFITTPASISYPAYTKPGVEKDTLIIIQNAGNTDLVLSSVVKYEDSCKGPGCTSGWLSLSGEPTVIPVNVVDTMIVKLNYMGVITDATSPHQLWGRVVFIFNGDLSSYIPISFVVADSIADVKFDTITTAANIRLVCGSNGNAGRNYTSKVNMNFNPPVECDTGPNSRGDANIYLGDASPVIVRKVGTNPARASWSLFSQAYGDPNGFRPLPPGSGPLHGNPPAHTNSAKWQQFFSGTFVTVDSLLKVEKTWYAPTNSADTANFVIEKLQIWPANPGTAVTNLAIGAAYDWDIPSDSGSANAGGTDATRRLVYQRGFNSADSVVDCLDNSLRLGGSALIAMSTGNPSGSFADSCQYLTDTLYGGYTARNDSFVYPASGFLPEELWNNMQTTGYFNQDGSNAWTDLHTVLTFRNKKSTTDGGWTLPAQLHDTLTIYSVMAVVRGATSHPAGLDSLKSVIDKGKKWCNVWIHHCTSCCHSYRGDLNDDGKVDMIDLIMFIRCLMGGGCSGVCMEAMNVNGAGIPDLVDLSSLVSYLTGGSFKLIRCP